MSLAAGHQSGTAPARVWAGCAVGGWWLAVALAAWGAPAPEPPGGPENVAAVVGGCLERLEALRPSAVAKTEDVAAVVEEGLGAIEGEDAGLRAELESLGPAQRVRTQEDKAREARRRELRNRRCRLVVLGGELFRRAAEAVPEGCGDRKAYLEKAIKTFRSLRVDYHDLALGMMGYVGEARAQRLAGDPAAAQMALRTVLDLSPQDQDGVVADLRRMALVESVATQAVSDAEGASAGAAQLRGDDAFSGRPLWQARLDWELARALAAHLESLPSADARQNDERLSQAARVLRDAAVGRVAPAYDRLALLARVDEMAAEDVMTPEELLAWGDALAGSGRGEALAAYDRARGGEWSGLGAKRLEAYAAMAMRAERYAEAADACGALLEETDADMAARGKALEWRAAALVKALGEAEEGVPREALETRALGALVAVVGGGSGEAVRRDSLRQWVGIESRRRGMGACAAMLAAHAELVEGDAYLAYARSAGAWEQLAEAVAAGEAPDALGRARAVLGDLEAAEAAAGKAGRAELAARCVLARAQVLAEEPVRDRRAALEALQKGAASVAADEAVAWEAEWLRVELLLDLGMVEAASKALGALPEGRGDGSGTARLRLAEALAARYGSMAPEGRAEIQKRVLRLCDAAMAGSVGSEEAFVEVSRRAARAMLAAGAHADARRVLEKLLESKRVAGDAALRLEVGLAAAALEAGGEGTEALGRLDALASGHPRSVAVHVARGRARLALGRPEEAVESFRAARLLARPGSADWCGATLALAEGLVELEHTQAATDILRVAATLYPDFGNAELRAEMRRMRRRLDGRPAGASRGAG